MITLVAILCQGLICTDVEVPTPQMVAGKCSDPQCSDSVPQGISLWDCQMHGEQLIVDWKANSGQWREWNVKAWKCVQGKYVSSQRA